MGVIVGPSTPASPRSSGITTIKAYNGRLLSERPKIVDALREPDAGLRRPPGGAPAGEPAPSRAATSRSWCLAREIERRPSLLLLVGQPTRGVDIGAIEFIHRRLIEMRDTGAAILLVSAELEEVMALSDRIAVLFQGRIVGTLDAGEASTRQIGLMMAGEAAAA